MPCSLGSSGTLTCHFLADFLILHTHAVRMHTHMHTHVKHTSLKEASELTLGYCILACSPESNPVHLLLCTFSAPIYLIMAAA